MFDVVAIVCFIAVAVWVADQTVSDARHIRRNGAGSIVSPPDKSPFVGLLQVEAA